MNSLLLIFGLLLASTSANSLSSSPTIEESKAEIVSITLQTAQGNSYQFQTTYENLSDFSESLDKSFDVVACTHSFSNGECTVTASSCSAAQAGFEACACASGHTRFCEQA